MTKQSKNSAGTFSFCVGKPWKSKKPNELCIYAHGGQVQVGTIEDARQFRDYVKSQNEGEYFIYRLEKIE